MGKTGKPAWLNTWVPPVLSRERKKPEPEQFTVFIIDGEEFTAPVEVPAAVALGVLRILGDFGINVAVLHLLRATVGDAALAALEECPDLEMDELRGILDKVREAYLGQIRDITNLGN